VTSTAGDLEEAFLAQAPAENLREAAMSLAEAIDTARSGLGGGTER
jgi:hypothetical protein